MDLKEWLIAMQIDENFNAFMDKLRNQKANLTISVMNSDDEQPLKRGQVKGIDWVLRLPENLIKMTSTDDDTIDTSSEA